MEDCKRMLEGVASDGKKHKVIDGKMEYKSDDNKPEILDGGMGEGIKEDESENKEEEVLEVSMEEMISDCVKKMIEGMDESELSAFVTSRLCAYVNARSSSSSEAQIVLNAFFETLFDDAGKGFGRKVLEKKAFLVAMNHVCPRGLLHALEPFSSKCQPQALREIILAVKLLRDDQLLKDEDIIAWHEEGVKGDSKEYPIWNNVKPFVDYSKSNSRALPVYLLDQGERLNSARVL